MCRGTAPIGNHSSLNWLAFHHCRQAMKQSKLVISSSVSQILLKHCLTAGWARTNQAASWCAQKNALVIPEQSDGQKSSLSDRSWCFSNPYRSIPKSSFILFFCFSAYISSQSQYFCRTWSTSACFRTFLRTTTPCSSRYASHSGFSYLSISYGSKQKSGISR